MTIVQNGTKCKHLNNKHVYLLPLPKSTKWVSWEHLKQKKKVNLIIQPETLLRRK